MCTIAIADYLDDIRTKKEQQSQTETPLISDIELYDSALNLWTKQVLYHLLNNPVMEEAANFESFVAKVQMSRYGDLAEIVKKNSGFWSNYWLPNIIMVRCYERLQELSVLDDEFEFDTLTERTCKRHDLDPVTSTVV